MSTGDFPGAVAPERQYRIDVGGLGLAVHEWGNEAGQPLFLVHGGFDFSRTYEVFAPKLAAGVRADLPEGERAKAFAGHSLRAGLASSAEADEAHIQRQLGHASAEMTRRYKRRREQFRVNLTMAAGL